MIFTSSNWTITHNPWTRNKIKKAIYPGRNYFVSGLTSYITTKIGANNYTFLIVFFRIENATFLILKS